MQLTGDEKRLLRVATGRLFATGRLDFNLLGCVDERLPMAWHNISSKPVMIVFENTGTFSVARRLLQSLQNPPYGFIGFGGGAALEYGVRYLRTIERPLHAIYYVGDLDRAGLRIVHAARKAARQEGLPDILPAPGLHAAMLSACERFNEPLGWPHDAAVEGPLPQDEELLEWLPSDTRSPARAIIQAARRVPEEILGPDELASEWNNAVSGPFLS